MVACKEIRLVSDIQGKYFRSVFIQRSQSALSGRSNICRARPGVNFGTRPQTRPAMPLIVRRTLLVTLIIFTLVGLPSFYLAHRPDHAAAILHSAADRIASKSKQGGVGGGGSYGGGGDDYHWDKGGLQPEPDHDWEDERPRDSLSLDEEEFVAEVIDYGSHSRRPSAGESISGGSSPKLTNSGISHVSHTEEDEHLEEEDEDEQSSPRDWLNENGKSASRLGSASGSGFGLEKLLSGGDQEDQEINDLDGGVIMPKLGNETAK